MLSELSTRGEREHPRKLGRARYFFSVLDIATNSVFSWAFSGDPMGRPYSIRQIRCL